MAEVPYQPVAKYFSGFRAWKWVGITEGDTCQPIFAAELSDKSIQAYGTFGGGGIDIEGSLDDTEGTTQFITLTDQQGTGINFTAAGIKSVLQNVLKIRPKTPTGVAASITVILLAR